MLGRLSGFAVLLLVWTGSIVRAQEFATTAEKPIPAPEKKAFDLLQTIAGQITNLHARSNRIQAECVVADMLWVSDEKTARSLFKTLSGEMVALIADTDFSDQQSYQQLSQITQQRQDIVRRIAPHEPDLALEFLHETQLPAGAIDSRANWYFTNETNLELQIAAMAAARNPARALEMARANLSKGVTYGLVGLLNQIQQKDLRSAQKLYKEMIDQIKSEDLGRNQDLNFGAWNLLGSFQPPKANEDDYRELISVLTDAVLSITPADPNRINFAQNVSAQIQSSITQIEKFAPERATSLRQWSQGVQQSLDPNARMYGEMNELSQHGTIDDMLAFAEKYPPEMRNQIYQSASWKAFTSGDRNRARQIVSDFISDPMQRRAMLEQFDNQQLNAADADQVLEARRQLGRAKTLDRKIQILTQLAGSLAATGDKKSAVGYLNEARGLADTSPPSATQVQAELQLVQAYAKLDPDQSFAIMQPLIAKANELIAAAAVLDGFENRFLKDGEWAMPGVGNTGGVINNLYQGLATLGRLDFDRARALADQFDRPEVRLMAQLAIAQAALNDNRGFRMGNRQSVIFSGGSSFIID
jgi:hypothetical protein